MYIFQMFRSIPIQSLHNQYKQDEIHSGTTLFVHPNPSR